MTDALSIALQKLADGGAHSRPQTTAPFQTTPAASATAPTAHYSSGASIQLHAAPVAATMLSPTVVVPTVAVPTVALDDPGPSILQMPLKPAANARPDVPQESPPHGQNHPEPTSAAAITIPHRPALQLSESPHSQLPAPMATITLPQSNPETNVPETAPTTLTSRSLTMRLLTPLNLMQQYRTLLTAVVVAAVIGVVWSDSQRTSQNGNTATEINIEQLLKEFETADQRASDRNADRATPADDLASPPEFAIIQNNSAPGSVSDTEIPADQSSTGNPAVYADSAVYPAPTLDSGNSAEPAQTDPSGRAKPVRFSGRIQPLQ